MPGPARVRGLPLRGRSQGGDAPGAGGAARQHGPGAGEELRRSRPGSGAEESADRVAAAQSKAQAEAAAAQSKAEAEAAAAQSRAEAEAEHYREVERRRELQREDDEAWEQHILDVSAFLRRQGAEQRWAPAEEGAAPAEEGARRHEEARTWRAFAEQRWAKAAEARDFGGLMEPILRSPDERAPEQKHGLKAERSCCAWPLV